MLDLLYVHKVATHGGVERVLLNRAEVFKRHHVDCRMSLYFYEDKGGLAGIKEYVASRDLGVQVRFVDAIEDKYDFVVAIDAPEILQAPIPKRNVIFECHTTYHESRRYLNELPDWVRMVLVPSETARCDIAERFPHVQNRLEVLHNCIPVMSVEAAADGLFWQKSPLLYLGRMDAHKNILEVFDLFQEFREEYGDDFFLLLVGPVGAGFDLAAEAAGRGITGRVVVLPPVAFDRVQRVLSMVKRHRGIFVSCSKGESFGLSAAEALSSGVPVLLSGIPAHAALVQGGMQYLYPLGDVRGGARKLRAIYRAYDDAASDAVRLGEQFSEDHFLSDWHRIASLL